MPNTLTVGVGNLLQRRTKQTLQILETCKAKGLSQPNISRRRDVRALAQFGYRVECDLMRVVDQESGSVAQTTGQLFVLGRDTVTQLCKGFR
ncbi:hypothetical protein D3C80_1544740 [compost metagenome]